MYLFINLLSLHPHWRMHICITPPRSLPLLPSFIFIFFRLLLPTASSSEWMRDNGHFPLAHIVHVDPDILRSRLPEWSQYTSLNPEIAGSLTHSESGYCVEIIQEAALRAHRYVYFVIPLENTHARTYTHTWRTCAHAHKRTRTHTRARVHAHTHVHTCARAHTMTYNKYYYLCLIFVSLLSLLCVCICIGICMCIIVYIYVYVYMYICIYVFVYI